MTIEDKAAAPNDAGAGLARIALSAARMLLGLVLIGLVLLNVVNAVGRAVGTVVIGVDEVLVFGMIWMVMIGMMLVTADRSHIALEILTARVGARARCILSIMTHIVMVGACGYAAVQSFAFIQRVTRDRPDQHGARHADADPAFGAAGRIWRHRDHRRDDRRERYPRLFRNADGQA